MGMIFLKLYFHLRAAAKKAAYKLFFGKHIHFGKGTTFRKGLSLYLDKGANIHIGDACFFNNFCSLNALDSVKIGDRCIFGEGVKIYDHNHKFQDKVIPIKEQGFQKKSAMIAGFAAM